MPPLGDVEKHKAFLKHCAPALASIGVCVLKSVVMIYNGKTQFPDWIDLGTWASFSFVVSATFRVFTDEKTVYHGNRTDLSRPEHQTIQLYERVGAILFAVLLALLNGLGGVKIAGAMPFGLMVVPLITFLFVYTVNGAPSITESPDNHYP